MHGTLIMPRAPWPTHGGREVYSHHLLAALDQLGHSMRAVFTDPGEAIPSDWPLATRIAVEAVAPTSGGSSATALNWIDRRWRKYWGWSDQQLGAIRDHLHQCRPTFVAAAGLQMLPALSVVPEGIDRIWLALDEPSRFQMSIGRSARSLAEKAFRLKLATTFAAYQRTYAGNIDVAVAVSDADAKSLQRIGGFKQVLCLPNGVDADAFAPQSVEPDPCTAVFWGRLDFQPNIQALRWFSSKVWPTVVQRNPHARFRIIGRDPDPHLEKELCELPGVEWIGPVDDIRPWANRSSVVVLPIQSGAGIKNKLLEAAVMARPIVASPKAVTGLVANDAWHLARTPSQWVASLERLWGNGLCCAEMGRHARSWVLKKHCWTNNATQMLEHVHRQRAGRAILSTELRKERQAA